uniref:F-box domain-containing protein n=1 Tax=Steinernema glaseri TaxID=37863 RepID=A0A1I7XYN1_9BILA
MNSVPDAFLDDVCCQLDRSDLYCLKGTCSRWSSLAAIHHSRRRSLKVFLDVNREGNEVAVGSKELRNGSLDPKYDRISRIQVGCLSMDEPAKTSMECFKKKVLPILRSLTFDCDFSFTSNKSFHHADLADSTFSGLHDCSQLTRVYITGNYAGNCAEFIKHQISLGGLKELYLKGDVDWPADLQDALRLFVKSPNFEKLDVFASNLTIDIYMAIAFVERFLYEDLSRMTQLQGSPSFPLTWLKQLHRNKQKLNYTKPRGMIAQWTRSSGGKILAKHGNTLLITSY